MLTRKLLGRMFDRSYYLPDPGFSVTVTTVRST